MTFTLVVDFFLTGLRTDISAGLERFIINSMSLLFNDFPVSTLVSQHLVHFFRSYLTSFHITFIPLVFPEHIWANLSIFPLTRIRKILNKALKKKYMA